MSSLITYFLPDESRGTQSSFELELLEGCFVWILVPAQLIPAHSPLPATLPLASIWQASLVCADWVPLIASFGMKSGQCRWHPLSHPNWADQVKSEMRRCVPSWELGQEYMLSLFLLPFYISKLIDERKIFAEKVLIKLTSKCLKII